MLSPSATIPLPLPITGWWLPLLGVLLAGLGVALVTFAVGDLVAPVRSARSIAGATVALEPIAGPAVLTVSVGRGAATGAAPALHAAPGQFDGFVDCRGADLATGQRAESVHLATVALLRPADCGDLRDVIRAMASLPHLDPTTDSGPPSWSRVGTHQTESMDVTAAALYRPPDRQPQVVLEEVGVDGGRGRARNYVEETAASRLLVP